MERKMVNRKMPQLLTQASVGGRPRDDPAGSEKGEAAEGEGENTYFSSHAKVTCM